MPKYGEIPTAKRFFDIIVSILVLLIALPFIVLVLILIKLTQIARLRPLDPLFYSEIRYSGGHTFKLYKFNIFHYEEILADIEAGKFIHTKTYEQNNQVLWIGWILKQIYMDELPQFYNVLIGEMSIVGPRPVNREVYDQLMSVGVDDKNKIRAGITGSFQSQKNTPNRGVKVLDHEYVEYCLNNPGYKVVWFDIKIILRTFLVVLRAQGI